MTPESTSFDEKAAFKEFQRQLDKLLKPLAALSKPKPGTDAIAALDAGLKAFPPSEVFSQAVTELIVQATDLLQQVHKARAENFGRLESAFVRAAESAGKSIRELDSGWRIGPHEFHLQRQQAQARVLYNQAPVINWTPVKSDDDLHKLAATAEAVQQKHALPDSDLPALFYTAFEQACALRKRKGELSFNRVPVTDLLRELRVALVRHELLGQKPDRKITTAEMPMWALLYNLDRYRVLSHNVADEHRLTFETGSQLESQNIGVTVNGLDARRDYQVVCYAVCVKE